MEARASLNGASVSKTFVAAILVLVAMGLGAMGGYVAKGLSATGTAGAQTTVVHAAPGTVLRQDNPVQAPAELPSYIQQEFPKATPRIRQDDPQFISQYAPQGPTSNGRGSGGRHGEI